MANRNNKDNTDESRNWREFASFVVEFQLFRPVDGPLRSFDYRTTIHHMENACSESWEGIETTELYNWLNHRIDEIKKELEITESPLQRAEAHLNHGIEVSYVRVFESHDNQALCKPGGNFFGVVSAETPFHVEICLLARDEAKQHIRASETSINTDLTAIGLDNENHIRLAAMLTPCPTRKTDQYLLQLSTTGLPRGTYLLEGDVVVASHPPWTTFVSAPLLQIV